MFASLTSRTSPTKGRKEQSSCPVAVRLGPAARLPTDAVDSRRLALRTSTTIFLLCHTSFILSIGLTPRFSRGGESRRFMSAASPTPTVGCKRMLGSPNLRSLLCVKVSRPKLYHPLCETGVPVLSRLTTECVVNHFLTRFVPVIQSSACVQTNAAG